MGNPTDSYEYLFTLAFIALNYMNFTAILISQEIYIRYILDNAKVSSLLSHE